MPVLIVIALLALTIVFIYNGLVRLRVQCDNAWADIDVQLKRRYDLIPNLVETVKGYAAHEKGTFDAVVAARNQAMSAQGPAAKGEAEGMLTGALAAGVCAGRSVSAIARGRELHATADHAQPDRGHAAKCAALLQRRGARFEHAHRSSFRPTWSPTCAASSRANFSRSPRLPSAKCRASASAQRLYILMPLRMGSRAGIASASGATAAAILPGRVRPACAVAPASLRAHVWRCCSLFAGELSRPPATRANCASAIFTPNSMSCRTLRWTSRKRFASSSSAPGRASIARFRWSIPAQAASTIRSFSAT